MSSSFNSTRRFVLIAALLAVVGVIMNAASASASCCNINIRNSTDCRFEACLDFYTHERCVVIHPGGNNFNVPECPGYRLVVHDACGVTHHFPTVVGTSINVITSRGCCLRIYLASDCCWEVTYAANCDPCNP